MPASDSNKYLRILRKKWKTSLWKIRNLPSRIHKDPVFLFGNQKTGSTAMTALLAKATGKPTIIDIFCRIPYPAEQALLNKTLSFPCFIADNKWVFSKPLIKEPGLIFLLEDLIACFPDSRMVFFLRDPRDNIRSILNRLQLPGNQTDITQDQFRQLPSRFWKMVFEGSLFQTRGRNYMETLSLRWKRSVELYECHSDRILLIRYEDFLNDKAGTIYGLAEKLGLQVLHDIASQVDVQYQPKGNSSISGADFFGRENLSAIETICKNKMKKYGYEVLLENP